MAEIDIYIADIENIDWERAYAEQGSFFEQGRIARIEKCGTPSGRKNLICTGLTVKHVFDLYNLSTSEIAYDDRGKPFLRGREDLFFNVSNSGKYVVIAVSDKPVGIDIQKPVPFREGLVRKICSEAETAKLGDETRKRLNLVWAVKEAYTKLTGTGIAMDLKTISYDLTDDCVTVFHNNNRVAFGKVVFSEAGYETVVLSGEPSTIGNINYINLQE